MRTSRTARTALVRLIAIVALVAAMLPSAPSPAAAADIPTTIYLPNITRMLGGVDGWQTPFIVQNVGSTATDLSMEFYSFADGSLVKTRFVSGLASGNSIFHDPNGDAELPAGGQFSVVIRSSSSAVVSVVNEHQNVRNASRQEALSYLGLSSGSTKVYLPYVAKDVSGWLTTFVIQNVGTATANVTATFTAYDGSGTLTVTRSMEPGRAQFVNPLAEPTIVSGKEYAVTLTSDQPIGAIVNAHNDAAGVVAPMGFSYNGVPATSETVTYVPFVARGVEGRTTRLFVQNNGAFAGTPVIRVAPIPTTGLYQSFSGPVLPPGAGWSLDLGTTNLFDGSYSAWVAGPSTVTGGVQVITPGQFAVVAATSGPTSAMGATGTGAEATRLFLPNITRNLGGLSGWTTPFYVQSTGGQSATIKFYRFSDGGLVTTRTIVFTYNGETQLIDPRSETALLDDSQYAVVIEAEAGGVAAAVSELNASGGDGAMAYEAAAPPQRDGACTPDRGPLGTVATCVLSGLTPGAAPTVTLTDPQKKKYAVGTSGKVAADGRFRYQLYAVLQGTWTVSATTGTVARSASATFLPPSFLISVTESKNGSVKVTTEPGLACYLNVFAGDKFLDIKALYTPAVADASGSVAFTYPKLTTPKGTAYHWVFCTRGSETPFGIAAFTIP